MHDESAGLRIQINGAPARPEDLYTLARTNYGHFTAMQVRARRVRGLELHLDRLVAGAFDGYIVRKDLVRKFKGQYPVPTYVAEFLLGRYCSSVEDEEIADGRAWND